MKFSNPKFYQNEIKDINELRKKNIHQYNSKINNQRLLGYKESSKINNQLEEEEIYYNKNKNKKNEFFHIQPNKSASIPSKKKVSQYNNVLSEENLINLMNQFINYSLNKNQNNKKKKLIRNNLTNYNEENKENIIDDKKKICMESLIKKGIITEIKDLQKPKKETLKDKLTQKKKSFLEDIGIETNNITSFQDSINENNKEQNKNDDDGYNNNYYNTFSNIYSTNKSIKHFSPNQNDDLYDEEISSDKEYKKTPLKPKINQFEYIRKIKKERSKIQSNPNYTSVQPLNSTSKFMKIPISKTETTLNDSFRQKNEKKIKKFNYLNCNLNQLKKYTNNKINLNKVKVNSIKSSRYSESVGTNDEYPFSHKKTYRSPDELYKYIKNKRNKNKEIEEKKINKKNEELLIKYKNLCTLNNNFNNNYNIYCKKLSPDYYNTISIKNKTHTSGFGPKDKKRENSKILLANDSFKNINSTLIDANEYYLNILESKKLIFKNIYSKTETQFYSNKNNKDNELKNIDEYFKNKSYKLNNQKINEQKEMIRKISKKINDTLIKAQKVFSLEDSNNSSNDSNKDVEINNKEINNLNNLNNNDKNNQREIKDNKDSIPKEEKKQEIKEENEYKETLDNKDNKEIEKSENKNNEIKKEDKNEIRDNNIDFNNKEDNIKNENKNEDKKETPDSNMNTNVSDMKIEDKEIYNKKLNIFVKIINITIKKNIFLNLCKYYVKIVIFSQYFEGISSFISFCKKYPFIKLREYYYSFKIFPPIKHIINVFIKKHKIYFFNKLKEEPKKLVNIFPNTNFDINNSNKYKENNKLEHKDEPEINSRNNKIKELIENDKIIDTDKLTDEITDDKINSLSDFYNSGPNNIITSNENNIKNDINFIKKDRDRNIFENNNINININNDENEKDISAEKDKDNDKIIEWETIESNKSSKKDIQPIKNIIKNDEQKLNKDNDNTNNQESKSKDTKTNELLLIKNNNKNDKSRNGILYNNEGNEEKDEIEKIPEIKNEKLNKELEKINIDKLTGEIIDSILSNEISSKDTILIPKKKFKYEIKLKKSRSNLSSNDLNSSADNLIKNNDIFDISGLSQFSLSDDLSALDESIMSAYTNKSFFNKTIIDKKKYNLLYFYQKYIAPRLIKLIKKEIITKYDRIYDNISKPYINNSEKIMISLIIQDANMLRENFKSQIYEENISEIIDKDNLLKKFEPINKKIRDYWKIKEIKDKKIIKNDNNNEYNKYILYDEYLNSCLIDCCIELINGERKYGENGNPLIWSSRNRDIEFKYKKNEPNKLADFVCRNLFTFLKKKVGLICDNYECMLPEQINLKREKKLVEIIRNELDEGDYLWKNLEMEETQLKVEVSDNIMDQLYNEVIEILEHIQLNRNKSELYWNKSIYACEDMPKLSFQQTTTENIEADDNDNDKDIDIENLSDTANE